MLLTLTMTWLFYFHFVEVFVPKSGSRNICLINCMDVYLLNIRNYWTIVQWCLLDENWQFDIKIMGIWDQKKNSLVHRKKNLNHLMKKGRKMSKYLGPTVNNYYARISSIFVLSQWSSHLSSTRDETNLYLFTWGSFCLVDGIVIIVFIHIS